MKSFSRVAAILFLLGLSTPICAQEVSSIIDRIPPDCIDNGSIRFTCPMLTLPIHLSRQTVVEKVSHTDTIASVNQKVANQ